MSVALVDLDRGGEALRLREKFESIEANARTFHVTYESEIDPALRDTRDGKISAAIVIPEDYSRRVNQGNRPRLGLVLDNTDPWVVSTLTQKIGELVDAVNQADVSPRYLTRVALEVVELYPYVEYIEYLLPGSITLAIFVCALVGGGLLYIDDKARGYHEGYLVSPVTKLQLVAGMLASGTVKAAFAGIMVTLIGSAIAGVADLLTPSKLLLLLFFNLLVAFSLISMVCLLMVRVNDPVVPRVMFAVLNTMLFFPSGAMYPIYSFPQWLQVIAKVDPFTYAVHGFRSLLLKDVGITAIWGDMTFLAGFSLVCFVGGLALFPRKL
jgi:ABC-2 type transport system permease protein